MIKNIFSCSVIISILLSLSSCGGGSSGTAIGGGGDATRFAGMVVSPDGKGVASAQVTILDTEESTVTDEAGAFELNSSFVSGEATLEVESASGSNALVNVEDTQVAPGSLDVSILFNQDKNSATLLDLTMRARFVRNCSPFFLNTRTIKQTAPIIEGLLCTLEVEFKDKGLPKNDLVFELQHRGCGAEDAWEFSGVAKTGTSGPGVGEINFNFKNDEKHCVYRVIGPREPSTSVPISTQINTLRKQKFDTDN